MEAQFHYRFFRTEFSATMADVAAIKQYPDESTEDYLARFKAMRSKCRQDIEETVAVQLALKTA